MRTRMTLIFFFLMSSLSGINGQTTQSNSFWLGFMDNLLLGANDNPIFTVVIHAEEATNGTIEVPTTGLEIPFVANVGTTLVDLPDAIWYTLQNSEVVDNKGILITTDSPVRASAIHYRAYFSESTHLLPTERLGSEYLVTCYLDDAGNSPTEFVIVSTEDGTEVEITPSTLTQGLHQGGVPFTVMLDRGQTYQVKAAGDLTGSYIRSLSGVAIAVFSGAERGNVELCSQGADSHMYDQCQPLEQWDDLYYHVPFSGQGGDMVKVVASEDSTVIYFDCEEVALLDRGEFHLVKLQEPTVIRGNHNIAVSQFNSSGSCNASGLGDPNMLRLFPIEYGGTSLRFFASDRSNELIGGPYFTAHFVNIIAKTSEVSGIQLDGQNIGAQFSPYPGDGRFSWAQLEVAGGAHQLTASTPIQAYNYGFGEFDAYTTHLGYSERNTVNFADAMIDVGGVPCLDSLLVFDINSDLNLVEFHWNFGNNLTSDDAHPATFYAEEGIYQVQFTGTDENGCTVLANLDLNILQCDSLCQDTANIELNIVGELCIDSTLTLAAITPANLISYEWYIADREVELTPEVTTSFSESDNYTAILVAFDSLGCEYRASSNLFIEDCPPDEGCEGKFPNVFTPNGDELNDYFGLYSNCTATNFQMRIYNRWGQLVFESNAATNTWDGRYKDQAAPSEVYLWQASYNLPGVEEKISKSGDVTLLR